MKMGSSFRHIYAGLFFIKNWEIGGLLNIHKRTQPNLAKGQGGSRKF